MMDLFRDIQLAKVNRIILLLVMSVLLSKEGVRASQTSKGNFCEIKVVSWNIQMLPNTFSLFSKSLRKKQRIRAPWIIRYIKDLDADLIVFQEVFDKGILRKLKKSLKIDYPYQVDPVKGKGHLLSNGILILSRFPVKYLDHVIYEKSEGSDSWASKGCTLVELMKDGQLLQVAGTHLQAGIGKVKDCNRDYQFHKIRELLDRNESEDVPVLIVGDMNTRKANKRKYSRMLKVINAKDICLDDERPYTIDSFNSWKSSTKPCQLDYILYQDREAVIRILNSEILRPSRLHKGQDLDLADHYAIFAELEIFSVK